MKKSIFASLLLTAASLLFLPSCRDNTGDIVLDRSILDSAKPLTAESMNFDFPITTVNLYIVNDSIAVVHNSEQDERKLVEIYNLNSGALIWDRFTKGNGPEEILMGRSDMFNDTLMLEDLMRDRIVLLPIGKITTGEDFKPEFQDYSVVSTRIRPFGGKLLAVNPYCFNDKQSGIHNDGNRFILTDSSFNYKETNSYQYETFNVTNGNFIISYDNDRIIYYSAAEPLIEVYDTDLNLLRTVTGPELSNRPELSLIGNMVMYSNGIPYAYKSASCCNRRHVYLTYIGELATADRNYDDFDTYILKFDWNGNFIESYSIGHSVTSMSLSGDGKSLYVFGREHDGTDVLYRYPL